MCPKKIFEIKSHVKECFLKILHGPSLCLCECVSDPFSLSCMHAFVPACVLELKSVFLLFLPPPFLYLHACVKTLVNMSPVPALLLSSS